MREYEKVFESQDYTHVKQTVFESLAHRELSFLAKRVGKSGNPIKVFDLAGGKGYNGGSAAIIHRVAKNLGIKPDTIFFERRNAVGMELAHYVDLVIKDEHYRVQLGNYHTKITNHFIRGGRPYGMLYVDCHASHKLFTTLRNISNHPHHFNLDMFAHFSAVSFKRAASKRHSSLTIKDHIQAINKDHIYIREPLSVKERTFQWTFVVATNHKNYIDLADLRFHDIASEKGGRLLDNLSYTKDEILMQRELNG